MTRHDMDCRAFDERLADYLEGELAPAEHRQFEAHLTSCARCASLVRDLEQIRVGAAALPELTPSTDLWSGIARRIETPVVPFTVRPAPNPAPNVVQPRRTFDRWKNAAIAAALVAVTAGVTYTLTIARNTPTAAVAVSNEPRPAAAPSSPSIGDTANSAVAAAPQLVATAPTSPGTEQHRAITPASNAKDRKVAPEVTYSREIDQLRTIFLRNRSRLDPRTAAIIEANLKVIDDAIAQSKAALAQDPSSRFLNDQLHSALDKKVELLKTAAMLPNRT